MTRRVWVLAIIVAALIGSVLISVLPARASHPRDIAPSAIDPAWLALPASALPAGAVVDHSAVSDNADANGTTTPPDGFKSQLRIIHKSGYDQLGRLTGYRMDLHYTVQGTPAGSEYLASIYPSADAAKTAMDDAIGPGTLIRIIGQPLTHQCTVGDECSAWSGPNPGTTNNAVLAVFRHGPIVVETATQVPAASFSALEPALETTLFGFLSAADLQVRIALSGGPTKAPTNTPTAEPATATPTATATATNTAVPTDTPTKTKPAAKKCPKNASKKHGKCACKKGYVLKHGKCVKKKP